MRKEIIQRRYEQIYFPKVKKAIDKRISSLISEIKEGGVDAGMKFLSKDVDSGDLPKVIQDLYLKVGLRFARMQWSDLLEQKRGAKPRQRNGTAVGKSFSPELQTKGFGFNSVWVDFIKNYLYKFLLEKITYRVSETTREVLLNVLQESVEKGWGVSETVRALEELPLSSTQAAKIVRTEITRATNTGSMAAGSTFEYEQQKEWIAARDFRTRGTDPEDHASHKGLDGQIVDYDQPFIDPRNKDELMFPGDPKAKAESTVNCRCSVAVIAKKDENGRLIPKK